MLKVKRGQGGNSTTADSTEHTQHTAQTITWHWCTQYQRYIPSKCPQKRSCCKCMYHQWPPRKCCCCNCCCCRKRCHRPRPYWPHWYWYPPYTTYGPTWIGGRGTTNDYHDSGTDWTYTNITSTPENSTAAFFNSAGNWE